MDNHELTPYTNKVRVKYYDKEISLFFDNDPMNKCKFIKDRIYEIIPYINLAISSDRLEEIVSFFIDKNIFSKDISDNFEQISNVTIKI